MIKMGIKNEAILPQPAAERGKIKSMTLIALFSALTAVGAFITVPIPPVPFSMQIFFAMLAGALLGSHGGGLSVSIYVLLGLCGLPIFTHGGGPSYVFQPTFGYIVGFAAGAWLCGKVIELRGDQRFSTLLLGCFAGAAIDFVLGSIYFYLIENVYLGAEMGMWKVLYSTVLLFWPADPVLMVLAAYLAKRLLPILKREHLI